MAHPKTPLAVAKATGRVLHDPKRFKGRSEPAGRPLGAPSPHLSAAERAAWGCFQAEMGWLRESDRPLLEIASRLRVKAAEPEAGARVLALYFRALSALGGTPTARSSITMPPGDAQDPAEEFLN